MNRANTDSLKRKGEKIHWGMHNHPLPFLRTNCRSYNSKNNRIRLHGTLQNVVNIFLNFAV